MNISSTPFIYNNDNDYWPDYNSINQLNQRIDGVESEIALVNTHLSSDIENVSANLNAYVNDQANTTATNNIVVNNINANYASGKYANFANTNIDNAYIENLTVNKPVFDITLNTPHLENTTSLGGNFYNANLINPVFSGDASGDFNVVNVNTANISNLFINTQPTPISSSAVLGYDVDGRVIPIHATYDVGFPENADYLFTDPAGTAFAGAAATEVGNTNNLITAYAVKNAIDEVVANVNDSFNTVYNSLSNINAWQNTFANDVYNNFNDISNNFNDVAAAFNDVNNAFINVNGFINDSLNNVNNRFEDVANNFNDVNNNFANIDNSFNNVNNTANNLLDNVEYLKTALAPILYSANVSGWVNSEYPVNIRNITKFQVEKFADCDGTDVGDGATLSVSGTTATLEIPAYMWTMENMSYTFVFCNNFNQNIKLPDGVTKLQGTFQGCYNFNQNILIPNSVTIIDGPFTGCRNFNQNILIPNSVTNMHNAFGRYIDNLWSVGTPYPPMSCPNLNQNILIPNSVTDLSFCFRFCGRLNQNILIPNSATNIYGMFLSDVDSLCSWLNQPDMYIYSQNITDMHYTFYLVRHIGNIHIPTSVPKETSNYMYNCLVNNYTGYAFAPENIINDLPVDIEQWPPV